LLASVTVRALVVSVLRETVAVVAPAPAPSPNESATISIVSVPGFEPPRLNNWLIFRRVEDAFVNAHVID